MYGGGTANLRFPYLSGALKNPQPTPVEKCYKQKSVSFWLARGELRLKVSDRMLVEACQ